MTAADQRVWDDRVVRADGVVHDVSLAIDSNRRPVIAAWRDVETARSHLTLSRHDGSRWRTQTVVTGNGACCSLALDAQGSPGIAFVDLDTGDVVLASQNEAGRGWVTEVVAAGASGLIASGPSLAFAREGEPEVCFGSDVGPLRAALAPDGHWSLRSADVAPTATADVAYAVDPAGTRHIVSREPLANRLVYVHEQSGGWRRHEVPWRNDLVGTGFLGDGPAVAADADGHAHIAFWTHDGIVHAERSDDTWSTTIVIPDDSASAHPSIALDVDGAPMIACSNAVTGAVEFAWRDESGWHRETVGAPARVIDDAAELAVDEFGVPTVARSGDGGRVRLSRLNRPPIAQPNAYKTSVNTRLSGENVLATVVDREIDDLRVATKPVRRPKHGTVRLRKSGRFVYTPRDGFIGTDEFRYRVTDAGGLADVGTVSIRVRVPVRIWARVRPLADGRKSSVVRARLVSPSLAAMTAALQRRQGKRWIDVRRRRAPQIKRLLAPEDSEWGTGPFRVELRHADDGYALIRSEAFDMPARRGTDLLLSGDLSALPRVTATEPKPATAKAPAKRKRKPKTKPTAKPKRRPKPEPIFDPHNGSFGVWPVDRGKPRLARGARGDAVRYLQSVIHHKAGGRIVIDGIFESQTDRRVRDVQRLFKITIDGVVGPQTWPVIDFLSHR